MNSSLRQDNRPHDQMRQCTIQAGINPYAEGSIMIHLGNTQVLCTASISQDVPKWLLGSGSGWITAEYGMLPRATHTRNKREAASGKQGGRTVEIQRLIGRSLRASVDLSKIPETMITVDCDVLVADGGTRTASITGGWIALAHALNSYQSQIGGSLEVNQVAALSAGVVEGAVLVDLCYEEDSAAEFDSNIILDSAGGIIEFQGTAEKNKISFDQMHELFQKTRSNIDSLLYIQREETNTLKHITLK